MSTTDRNWSGSCRVRGATVPNTKPFLEARTSFRSTDLGKQPQKTS